MSYKYNLIPEEETILDSLLEFMPLNSQFKIDEIREHAEQKYDCILTEGLSYNKQTFYVLTKFLIQNGLAEMYDNENIKLTEAGRTLVKLRNYKDYVKENRKKEISEKRKVWKTNNWIIIEILRYLIPLVVGFLIGMK